MKKRGLSIILMLAMIISMIVVPQGAAVTAANYYDVEGMGVELAVDVLDALGIMNGYTDGSFLPYNTISRAEMASIAVKIAGLENIPQVASEEDIQFKDMYGYDNWASGVVAIARAGGIAKGDADDNFNPDMSATYEDAVQMVVCALGYESLAMSRGGRPDDYVFVGRRLGLLKKLTTGQGQNITRADVAQLVYNALTVDIMEAISYSADGSYIEYAISEGNTPLGLYFDVAEINGIITETEYAAILGDTSLDDGEIMINGEVFNVGRTNISDYLGYYVQAYALDAKEANEARTIIAFSVKNVKNNTLTIIDEDIEAVTMSVSGYTYEYWGSQADKKPKKVTTTATPLVLYNGKSVDNVTKDLLKPELGYVVLIDNNGDDKYDIIDIWEYELVYVNTASSITGSVTNYYNSTASYRFDADNDNYHVTFLNDQGGRATFKDISQYSVLYVYQSIDGTEKKVVISNRKTYGNVDEVYDDMFTVAGISYKISPGAKGKFKLSVSDTGDFYFDADGRIAGFEGNTTIRSNIGKFIAVNNGGLERGYQIKVLTQNNGVQIYGIAPTVKVNDFRMSAAQVYEQAYSNLLFGKMTTDGNLSGEIRPHPARDCFLYKVNSSNQITEMMVVDEAAPENYDANTGVLVKTGKLQPRKLKMQGSLYYSADRHVLHFSRETVKDAYGNTVGKRTYCDNSTVNFCSEEAAGHTDDNQDYFTRYMSSYWNNYNFDIYDDVWAYYYSPDGSEVDMQTTVCSFLSMYNWYDPNTGEGTESDNDRNIDAKWCMDNVAVKWIYKITGAVDKASGEETYKVYYFDGTSIRNNLIRPQYSYTAHMWDDANNPLYPNGYPVRIALDGSYIETIYPYFTTEPYPGASDAIKSMVEPIFNKSTNSNVMPFKPFYIMQRRKWTEAWNSADYESTYHLGMVTSIDEVVGLKFFTVAVATTSNPQSVSDISFLPNERLEGNVFRAEYDRDGKMSAFTKASTGDITTGQLVLVRRRAYDSNANWQALTGYSVNEITILADSVEELDYLDDFYKLVKEATE